MNKPGNYLLKARSSLDKIVELLPHREEGIKDLKDALHQATPFFLSEPALELIWRTDPTYPVVPRLPYPVMAVEMDFHAEKLVGREPRLEPAVQRILLASEIATSFDGERVTGDYSWDTNPDALLVTALWKNDLSFDRPELARVDWVFSLYSAVIPFSALSEEVFPRWCARRQDGKSDPGGPQKLIMTFDKFPKGNGMPYLVRITDREIYESDVQPGQDVLDEIRTLIGLLNLLECSNVGTAKIPAPERLNKKRRKTGKPLVPEYLTLRLSPAERQKQPSEAAAGRTHASPRTHWRRGHIRRQRHGKGLEKVKSVWIEPAIVGAAQEGEAGTPKILVK